MEKKMKMKIKQHKKHGHRDQLHRPLNGYELYEREHMPNMLVKLPSYDHRPKTRAHDYSEVGTPRSDGERVFRPDYYETGRTFCPPCDGRVVEQNIDVEAEKFIRLEHERFEPSKWM